jgi:P27 family predicted phage terminase small subunit
MPRYLNRDAKREWRRLAPILLAMGVLTEADGIALGNLCTAYATLIAAQRLMRKSSNDEGSGLLMKTGNGYVQQSPLLTICNRQMELINFQLREFGMTPASRSRVAAIPGSRPGVIDEIEKKLCGPDEDFLPGGKYGKRT